MAVRRETVKIVDVIWLTVFDEGAVAGCAPGRSRTCDLSLRRRLLYPLSYWGGTCAIA